MKRTRWKAHEVLQIVIEAQRYHRIRQIIRNAPYYHMSIDGWQQVSDEALDSIRQLGLPEVVIDRIKEAQ